MDQPNQPNIDYEIQVPSELAGGTYANFLTVWHSGHEFTLDFAVTQQVVPEDPEDPEASLTLPCRVVTRVKIPPTLIFEVIRALNENMTTYKGTFGEIPRLEATQEDTE